MDQINCVGIYEFLRLLTLIIYKFISQAKLDDEQVSSSL